MKIYASCEEWIKEFTEIMMPLSERDIGIIKTAWNAATASMESENKKLKERLAAADKVVEAAHDLMKIHTDEGEEMAYHAILEEAVFVYDHLTSNK